MYVRQVKRKCNVRGCKNTECFAISQTREVGNTVIICKSCLSSALGSLDEIDPKTKSNIPVIENKAVPSLFFNAEALGKSEVKDDLSVDAAVVDENPTVSEQTEPEEQFEEDEQSEDGQSKDVMPPDVGDETDEFNDEVFMCPNCAKTFDSMRGLQTHTRYCKSQNEE